MLRKVFVPSGALSGDVAIPPSKSAAHRAILCAALAKGVSRLSNVAFSQDIQATCRCVEALGAKLTFSGRTLTIDSKNLFSSETAVLNCGESGSTLRFFVPIAAAGGVSATFTGKGRLPQRPIGIYLDCLPPKGVSCQTPGGLPLRIQGTLKPGTFSLPGNISSQFITGLLLALPLLPGDSHILLTSPLESAGYVDMTLHMMRAFGVVVQPEKNGWRIPGGQVYRPSAVTIEGDWSQAAFFLAAGALSQPGSSLLLHGLQRNSLQGDRRACALFEQFGANLSWRGEVLQVSPGKLMPLPEIDVSQIPDLAPVLAATAALCPGVTRITGAGRLRIKESDRLHAIAEGIASLGGQIQELSDSLIINGQPYLSGGQTEGWNDHRIVMAMAVASLRCINPVVISDAESIEKSYPNFFDDFISLGGKADVL